MKIDIILSNPADKVDLPNQAWLGHSNYNTTANLYAHLDTSSVTNTGKVITNVFGTKKK